MSIFDNKTALFKIDFFKWANPGLFLFIFVYFLVIISIQIEKSIDGVLGFQTRGHRKVGADETTELWRPPKNRFFNLCLRQFLLRHFISFQHSHSAKRQTVFSLSLAKEHGLTPFRFLCCQAENFWLIGSAYGGKNQTLEKILPLV